MLAGRARRAQDDRRSIELGASRRAVTNGVSVEVVSVTADVFAKRVGVGKLVGCQDAHRFDCFLRYCCGKREGFFGHRDMTVLKEVVLY